jgi:hypothetical protein
MNLTSVAVAAITVAGLALTACGTTSVSVREPSAPAGHAPASSRSPSGPSPSGTTVTPPASTPAAPATVPNVTDPWAVVSAYYGDIESQDYQQAWALIGQGGTTGQNYQQFVNGFACTGSQQLQEVSESGDQVTFNLAATNSCTGQVQNFSGTDTVQNGMIVAANVSQTG